MARLHTTLITLTSLAVLALAGCAVDEDGDGDEAPAAVDDERPLGGSPEPEAPAEQDEGPGKPDEEPPHDPDECGDDCTSTMPEFGLVCTSCAGDDGPPECLVGSCNVIDRCLHCTDPWGRTAVDCSIDYESLPTESHGLGGGDNFNVCNVSFGFPGGASGECHYPGTESCTIVEDGGDACIECTYPGGSGSGACGDSESLPDIMAGRPSDLPEPGECVTETADDGVECSTCTRDDLSATKACRFAPAVSCDVVDDDPVQKCMSCVLEDGGTATICDDAGS